MCIRILYHVFFSVVIIYESLLIIKISLRRIHRFLGTGDVSPKVPRVFVRIVNSTREISDPTDIWVKQHQHQPAI